MSCKYTYKGKTYSKEELVQLIKSERKAVNKTIADEELALQKAIQKNPTKLNYRAIQKIMVEEAKNQGYSQAELLSLQLNEKEDGFEIPLWATLSASRFEALLNSIVDSRLVKQKKRGNSFVLGSETGLSPVRDWDSLTDKQKNDMTFIQSFNPKEGPKSQREENGDIKPAEVFISNKLKVKVGNSYETIDVKNYLIPGTNLIDSKRLPDSVLEAFGYRIPTQGLNSMSYIKVVGFLPDYMGDLIVGSKDWTVQMGSDFDVDKLFVDLFNIKEEDDTIVLDNSDRLGIENEMLKIQIAVMKNKSKDVQSQVISPLSFGWLKDGVDDTVDENRTNLSTYIPSLSKDKKTFNPLGPTYQKDKYLNAQAGKAGTGSFSLDSTFNIAVQGKNIHVKEMQRPIRFGEEVSNGDLSSPYTLRTAKSETKRFKSDVIAAYQSASVDNEKEQILDKLHVNTHTFAAIRAMNQFGFEEDVTAAFISQPIIKKYVNTIRSLKARNVYGDIESIARNEIEKLYDIKDGDDRITDAHYKEVDRGFDTLTKHIKNGSGDIATMSIDTKIIQYLYLLKFIEITGYGEQLKAVQAAVNMDGGTGLSSDSFENIAKEKKVIKLMGYKFNNIERLIGDYDTNKKEGGVYKDGVYITPKTIKGFTTVGLFKANELISELFPYTTPTVEKAVGEILNFMNREETTISEEAVIRKKVFRELKKFINAGFVSDPTNERLNLFVDTVDRSSLASLFKKIKNHPTLANNAFIQRIEPVINRGNKPSFLRYNASAAQNENEESVYAGFIDLIVKNRELLAGHEYDKIKKPINFISNSYEYAGYQREDMTDVTNTLQAIEEGKRTAHTFYGKDMVEYFKNARVGDIIQYKNDEGKTVDVKVTKELTKLVKDTPVNSEFDKLPSKLSKPTMTYAGIGSRNTPKEILDVMTEAANYLEKEGYTLNTGKTYPTSLNSYFINTLHKGDKVAAEKAFKAKQEETDTLSKLYGNEVGMDEEGADRAFSAGTSKKNLFSPTDKIGHREMKVAEEIHPNWSALKPGAAKLMARNTNQIFGSDLKTPVDFVLFYAIETKGIRPEGGTGQAVEMARKKGIPTINMAESNWRQKLSEVLKNNKEDAEQIENVEVVSENYTPALLRANTNKLFLFGDNNVRTGKGGQAIIRNEPNAMGISTKLLPKNTDDAFMSDEQLEDNKAVIDSDIKKAKERAAKEGKTIVLPKGGFGTGLAALSTKAPQTFAYLNQRLKEEFGFDNVSGTISTTFQTETVEEVSEDVFTDAQIDEWVKKEGYNKKWFEENILKNINKAYQIEFEKVEEDTTENPPLMSRDLAEMMINAAFLDGGLQEAYQYVRYLPISYLLKGSHADRIRNLNWNSPQTVIGGSDLISGSSFLMSNYSVQYAQHNPRETPEAFSKGVLYNKENDVYTINSDLFNAIGIYDKTEGILTHPPFFHIPSKSVQKADLYMLSPYAENDKIVFAYKKIPTLSTFGLNSEYNPHTMAVDTVLQKDPKPMYVNTKPKRTQTIVPFDFSQYAIDETPVSNTPVSPNGVPTSSNKTLEHHGLKRGDNLSYLDYGDILKSIAETSTNSFNKELAKQFKTIMDRNIAFKDVQIVGTKNSDYKKNSKQVLFELPLNGVTPFGSAYKGQVSINLDKNTNLTQLEHTILHEMNHIIFDSLNLKGTDLQRFKNYRTIVKTEYDKGTLNSYVGNDKISKDHMEYILNENTSVKEFIAFATNNSYFQDILKSIQYKGGDQTIWDKFIKLVRNIFVDLGMEDDKNLLTYVLGDIMTVYNFKENTNTVVKEKKVKKVEDVEEGMKILEESGEGVQIGDYTDLFSQNKVDDDEEGFVFSPDNLPDFSPKDVTSLEILRKSGIIENKDVIKGNELNKKC